jgi:hypothetical protein
MIGISSFMFVKILKLEKNIATASIVSTQNMAALTDKVRTVGNAKDGYENLKLSMLSTMDDLKRDNRKAYDEMSKVKGDLISYIDAKVVSNLPKASVSTDLVDYGDNKYGLGFERTINDSGFNYYERGTSQFRISNGVVSPLNTVFDTTSISIGITYGFKEINGKYNIFARSASNYIKIKDLNGALILDKYSSVIQGKPSRFSVSIFAGPAYDLLHNQPSVCVGVGVGYKIYGK